MARSGPSHRGLVAVGPRHALVWTARAAVRLTQGVAFWVGVLLPVCYLPAIVGGFVRVDAGTLVVLVGLNYLALLAGSGYGQSGVRARAR